MRKTAKLLFALVSLVMLLSMISCSGAGDDAGGAMNGGYGGGDYSDGDYSGGGPHLSPGVGDSMGDVTLDATPDGSDSDDGVLEDEDGEATEDSGKVDLPSGMITAGAWNDNDNYEMWRELFSQGNEEAGKFFDYTNPDNSWGFNSQNRVKVTVTSGDKAVAGARVVATDGQGATLFSAVTDAKGNAYLFPNSESGNIEVVKFVRYEKGEGLEKRNDDFAAEVAAQINK